MAIDDGVTNVVGLVIYNEDTSANTYTVDVYDSNGNFATSGTTPSIPPLQSGTQEGGTYAVLLDDLMSGLPSGPFKVLIDGGSLLSAVEVLQINGSSATTLQVAYDTAPSSASALKTRRPAVRRSHVAPTRKVSIAFLAQVRRVSRLVGVPATTTVLKHKSLFAGLFALDIRGLRA